MKERIDARILGSGNLGSGRKLLSSGRMNSNEAKKSTSGKKSSQKSVPTKIGNLLSFDEAEAGIDELS